MTPLIGVKLDDDGAERVRQSHARAITDLQKSLFAGAQILSDVTLTSGTVVTVAHGLGRAPSIVIVSAMRNVPGSTGVGLITEDRNVDRTRFVAIGAFAFGIGISFTVDLLVM